MYAGDPVVIVMNTILTMYYRRCMRWQFTWCI